MTATTTKMGLAPVIALSHGGGPMPLLGDPGHASINRSLQERIPKLLGLHDAKKKPKAIILVTAHWSTRTPTITSSDAPDLIYDYYGFPPEAYEIKYPAKGSSAIAKDVAEAMKREGLDGVSLEDRGWDHGVFVPLKMAIPAADIPIIQVSVLQSEDPAMHLRLGRALQSFRQDNIAIVGSGFASFHNIRAMMSMRDPMSPQRAELQRLGKEWNEDLNEVMDRDPEGRWKGLEGWRGFRNANVMHPPRGGEHFMPLIVCAGAAGADEPTRRYLDEFVGMDIYTYYWGAEEVE